MKVRFAPSPTGILHVGNARTALFNWLYARHLGGRFLLRIEDTDRERSKDSFVEDILDGLQWLGLDWDEGPVFQSERFEHYRALAERLVEAGHAYRCYCTEAELEESRQRQIEQGLPPRYSGACRDLSPAQEERLIEAGRKPSIRLRVPSKEISFTDLLRGPLCFDAGLLGDFVLIKSDGSASYNFAATVDDSEMGITHVLRGEDHLSNTPRQIILYELLDRTIPVFAHLPMILGQDKTKLSKRHGATAITQFREEGFLPEAMANYLALLGWAPPEREVLSLSEMVDAFQLEKLSHAGAVFDRDKLCWMNEQHLRKLSEEDYLARAKTFLLPDCPERARLDEALLMIRESLVTLQDLRTELAFFLSDDRVYPPFEVSFLEED
ncbi:MAG: glutamate--tRNA ligase, partial [Bacteroidota bacterium]